jgi:hypothetical protein
MVTDKISLAFTRLKWQARILFSWSWLDFSS